MSDKSPDELFITVILQILSLDRFINAKNGFFN